jgi:phosphoribosylaminoimidazole-succinocarboxamide synthase
VIPHHILATDPADFPSGLAPYRDLLRGRSVLVRRAKVVPFECVARGYLAGSGFREYRASGEVCGIPLPPNLDRASPLPHPIFTPATKAAEGHDENVTFATVEQAVGSDLAARLRDLTLALYTKGASRAAERDLILADTKFEFGFADDGNLLLIDEVMTPDSSRYWDVHRWAPGEEPASFDKQYVRNWLDASGWDHQSPPPVLPEEVVRGTRERYIEAFRRITGQEPAL